MLKALAVVAMLLSGCSADQTPRSSQQTELGAVVEATLAYPDIAEYLHPEIPGRLPVTVAFRSPIGISGVDATLFGQLVRVVPVSQDTPAIILGVRINGAQATIALDYPTEGMAGEILLQHNGTKWVVVSAQLSEQRPNNSFKPKPLRGSA